MAQPPSRPSGVAGSRAPVHVYGGGSRLGDFQFLGTELIFPAMSKLGRNVRARSLTRTHQRP
ncbi:mCG147630 [Mus musculus]|nr:mCG147630 [Mus musculus]